MKFKTPIEVQAGISDGDPTNPLGQAGYLLSSDGSNVNWVSPGGLSAETAEAIVQPIKANEALAKGDPLYIVGYQSGQNVNIVAKADSSDVAKMPVVGLADDDYANQAFGTMTAFGSFNGSFDTTGGAENWAIGDIIFVKAGGGLTNVKPGGTDLIQNIAIVSRVQQNTGELEVIALGRTNDVPNLPEGRLFVGTAANTSLASDVVYVDDTNDGVMVNCSSLTSSGTIASLAVGTRGGGSGPAVVTLSNSDTTSSAGDATGVIQFAIKDDSGSLGYTSALIQGSISQAAGQGNRGGGILDFYTAPWGTGNSPQPRMRVNDIGNVGIGTTSPSTVLEVSSTGVNGVDISQSASNASQSGRLFFTTNTASEGFALFNSNGTFQVNSGGIPNNTSGTNRISIIGSSGNVGIGTTSPPSKLSVSGGTLSVSGIQSSTGVIKLGDPTDPNPYVGIYRSAAAAIATGGNFLNLGGYDGIAFTTGAAQLSGQNECMRILSNGNVGIGTTSPSHKLEVGLTSNVALASQPAIPLMVSNDGYNVDGRVFIQVKNDVVNAASAVGAGFQMTAAGVTSGTASFENSLIFLQSKSPGNQTIHSAPQNIKFYVDNDGTSAGAGVNYSDLGDLSFELQSDGDGIFYHNLGIGTTSPITSLTLGTGSSGISFQSSSTTLNSGKIAVIKQVEVGNGNGHLAFETYQGGSGGGERMRILNDGNVGIGTISPAVPLDVEGKIRSSDSNTNDYFEIFCDGTVSGDSYIENSSNNIQIKSAYATSFSTSGSVAMFIDNNQNVGIGTTNPNYKLDVYGDLKLGTTGALSIGQSPYSNTIFYIGAGSGSTITFGAPASYQQNVTVQGDLSTLGGSTSSYLGTKQFGTFNNRLDPLGDNYLNSGNLGIGTTSPSRKLEVRASSEGSSGGIVLTDFTSGTSMVARLQDSATGGRLYLKTNTDSDGVVLNAGGDSYFNNGNVGIGTTAPQSKLQVNGGIQLADDTDPPSASKVGTFKYRTSVNNSYVDMCMQTGASTYAWVNIVTNSW